MQTTHNIQATNKHIKKRTSMTVAAAVGGGVVADWRSVDEGGRSSYSLLFSQRGLSPIYFSLYTLSD